MLSDISAQNCGTTTFSVFSACCLSKGSGSESRAMTPAADDCDRATMTFFTVDYSSTVKRDKAREKDGRAPKGESRKYCPREMSSGFFSACSETRQRPVRVLGVCHLIVFPLVDARHAYVKLSFLDTHSAPKLPAGSRASVFQIPLHIPLVRK